MFWQQAVRDYHCYPAADDSPIHLFPPEGYGEHLKVVPFSLLVPLALEVPYLDSLAQEPLPDRLIPASLYGLTVMRPAYTAEAVGPKSNMTTKTVVAKTVVAPKTTITTLVETLSAKLRACSPAATLAA